MTRSAAVAVGNGKDAARHAGLGGAAVAASDPGRLLRRAALLIACSLGIYATFLLYGILQERMYSHAYGPREERFSYSMLLVFFQCCGNALFALALGLFSRKKHSSAAAPPARAYLGMSASYIGAMFLSNAALGFMSYPAQALAKSSKMVPVMLSRLLLMRDVRYSRQEVAQVLLITAGILVFMIGAPASAGKKVQETSWIGLLLCLASLALDGYTGPAQERLNKQYRIGMADMMLWINLWAVALVAAALVVTAPITGELQNGLAFCMRNPSILPEAGLFSLMAASGQALILFTLLRFNSLVVVTVTTTRKFFTILLSVVLYGHWLTAGQWSGVALVFAGLGIDIVAKAGGKKQQQHHHHHTHAHADDTKARASPESVPLVEGAKHK